MNMSHQYYDDDMLEELLRKQAAIAMELSQQNELLQFQIDQLELSTPPEPSDEQELLQAISELQQQNREYDQKINAKTKELENVLKKKISISRKLEDVKNKQHFFKMKNQQNKLKIYESNREVVTKLSRQAYIKESIGSHHQNIEKMKEQLDDLGRIHQSLQQKLNDHRRFYKQLISCEGSSTFRTY